MTKLTDWKLVGYLPVDAGIMMFGDPCYVLEDRERTLANGQVLSGSKGFYYDDMLEQIKREDPEDRIQFVTPDGYSSPTSIITETGFGDGNYAVYIKYSDEGSWGKRVAEMKVVFIPDESEGNVCGYFESDCICDEFNYGNYCYECGEHEDDCICEEE